MGHRLLQVQRSTYAAAAEELNQKIAHNYLMYSNWYKE